MTANVPANSKSLFPRWLQISLTMSALFMVGAAISWILIGVTSIGIKINRIDETLKLNSQAVNEISRTTELRKEQIDYRIGRIEDELDKLEEELKTMQEAEDR